MSTTIIIIACLNIIFLCLGFWMGSIRSNQAIPGVKMPFKKVAPYNEYKDDPFEKAMTDPKDERIETVTNA